MTQRTSGIHHVTAIASDPQRNVDFYTEVLGLRLVKRTVNFDDEYTYHLYYGDELGTPGTVLTFFPFEGAASGRVGAGQVGATAFAVPPGSVDYWTDRFESEGVEFDAPEEQFGETVVAFRDHDGQPMELVAADGGREIEPWDGGPVPTEHAIRGFHSVTLNSASSDVTASVLETMGYEEIDAEADSTRYRGASERAGVLFEIATDPPGFTRDEDADVLGSELKLPEWLEDDRDEIERRLPEIRVSDRERAAVRTDGGADR